MGGHNTSAATPHPHLPPQGGKGFWYRWLHRPISLAELTDEMDQQLRFPGVANAWTMPIKARIDMLSTGVRTPIGIKVLGADLKEIEAIGAEIEKLLREVPGTRSVFAERVAGGYFLDFELRRDQLARYGLTSGATSWKRKRRCGRGCN